MYTPRILLIHADQGTHRGLRARLERRGCEVFTATTQSEAVRRAGEIEADLVVQENPVPEGPGSFDEVMDAIEVLVGPLPAPRPAATVGGAGTPARARLVRAPLVPAGSC